MFLRFGQLLVEHRIGIARRLPVRVEVLAPSIKVTIDLIAMGEIKVIAP